MTIERMMTTAEAADALRVDPSVAKRLCQRGRVSGAVRRAGRWFLPARWVRAEVRRRARATGALGRPTNIARLAQEKAENRRKTAKVDT